MKRINYASAEALFAASQKFSELGSAHQREAALLRRQARELYEALSREAHAELTDGSPDDKLVWASAPSGEEAWGVIDYTQHPQEPMFGVTYYDGDISVGVCDAGFESFEEALAFALTKPLVSGDFELTVVK